MNITEKKIAIVHKDLNDKIVLITGAAGGLGEALCYQFGNAGAKIAAIDIHPKKLQALKENLESKGIPCIYQTCDITKQEQCEQSIHEIQKQWGNIDILINNAGITHIERYKEGHIPIVRKVMEVNFFGSVYCTNACMNQIIENQGTIIAISSVAGFAPLLGRTAYSASKHALQGFFESLRTELTNKGVNIMMVCPSFIDTGIGESKDQPKEKIGKVDTPESIAKLICQGVLKDKRLLITGTTAKLSWWLKKWSPKLYDKIMINKMKNVS